MRYKFAKLDRISEPSTEAQILGSFVHEILEELFKLDAKDRNESSARQIGKGLWNHSWSQEFANLPDQVSTENEFRWKAWWCVENYFALEDPTSFDAVGIEQKVNGDIDGVPIFGIIDRWTLEDGKMVISDYKTGKKPKPRYEWEKQMQIMIYSILLEQMTEYEVKEAELIYLKFPSKAVYKPTEKVISNVKANIVQTWDELVTSCSTGVFETRTGPLCNWCSFKGMCPAWRK
jgi:putative RecB family exonuclease